MLACKMFLLFANKQHVSEIEEGLLSLAQGPLLESCGGRPEYFFTVSLRDIVLPPQLTVTLLSLRLSYLQGPIYAFV